MKLQPQTVGEVVEARALAILLQAGFVVSRPISYTARYDFVIEKEGVFTRIQVKTGRLKAGAIRWWSRSIKYRSGKHTTRPYTNEIDLFAVYCPELDKLYLVPVNHVGEAQGFIRVHPTKNKQDRLIRWASDYVVKVTPI